MPCRLPDLVGKPYHPSNGTDQLMFLENWCARCLRDEHDDCPILSASFFERVPEWVYNAEGMPSCTAFLEDSEAARAARYREEAEAAGQQRLPEG